MIAGATRRLFFALWPDEATRAAIVAATAEAVAAAGGRAVPPANLHVTLAFLGAVPVGRVADAVAAGHGVPVAEGSVRFDRLAAWGRAGPLVLEPGELPAGLEELHAALANRLDAAGFALESRPFSPHITLARKLAGRPSARRAGPVDWRYADFALVASATDPEGSRYTVLERFPAR